MKLTALSLKLLKKNHKQLKIKHIKKNLCKNEEIFKF